MYHYLDACLLVRCIRAQVALSLHSLVVETRSSSAIPWLEVKHGP